MSGILLATVAATAGSSPDTISVPGGTVFSFAFAPATSSAAISFTNNGKINAIVNGVSTTIGEWCVPNASAAEYEILATLTSGALTSGTVGSWQGLGTTRTWTVSLAVNGAASATIDLAVREILRPSVVLGAGTYNLESEREP